MYLDQRKALDLFFQYYQENLKKCLACFDYFQLIEVKKSKTADNIIAEDCLSIFAPVFC